MADWWEFIWRVVVIVGITSFATSVSGSLHKIATSLQSLNRQEGEVKA